MERNAFLVYETRWRGEVKLYATDKLANCIAEGGRALVSIIERKILIISWVKTIVLGMLGIAYSLWAIYGSGNDTVFYGFLLLLCGVPMYAIMKWNRRKE